MKIYLIRHSMTAGNLEKRYIGKTDEPLCDAGIKLLTERHYPEAERVYVSPLKRCIQTAEIIYPQTELRVIKELAECDFGIFENRNYLELENCPEYQEWIDSGGTLPFPGGESREGFQKRTLLGFRKVLKECRDEKIRTAALVVHGGTIMSIMEQYAVPSGGYYDYQIKNGEGYELVLADVCPGDSRVCTGSAPGRSGVAVSPGAAHRTFDHKDGKNYKKIHF